MADEVLHSRVGSAGADVVALTADIVAAYVGNNSVEVGDLPGLIEEIFASLSGLSVEGDPANGQQPAVPIDQSITDEYLICLEDGKQFKSLKRYLRTRYDMSPEQYRDKWRLPHDYPMVAPAYARRRSALAKQMGLGQGKN